MRSGLATLNARMRGLIPRLLLLATATAAVAPVRAAAEAGGDGEVIDKVWSGHPVGFALLAQQGHVILAYYDAQRRMTVAGRGPGETEWTRVQPEGRWVEARGRYSTELGWDSHNSIVLALDADGCLHLAGNLHVDPLLYYRSARPWDPMSLVRLDRMIGRNEDRCTYPYFFRGADERLYFSYRDGSSGDARELYSVYDTTAREWRRLLESPLYDGEGERSAYALRPVRGPDGRFHVLWMWRDTPDAATNHHLGYARSADLVHWEDAAGNAVPLPIRFGDGDSVDPAAPGDGLINTTYRLGFDREGVPVALYHRYDDDGHSQIFAARPAGREWRRRPVTDWSFRWNFGGFGSLDVDLYLLEPRLERDGTLGVPFTARAVPDGVLRVDPVALTLTSIEPPDPPDLPPAWREPRSTYPGMVVRTLVARDAGKRYVLRWETLPPNRDRPREEVPPPSALRLFVLDETVQVPSPAPVLP